MIRVFIYIEFRPTESCKGVMRDGMCVDNRTWLIKTRF